MAGFYNEILEQPDQLRNLIQHYKEENFASIKQAVQWMISSQSVVFSGMGTSYFAPKSIYGTLGKFVRPIIVEAGDLFENCISLIREGDTVVLISQSGESVEISSVLDTLPNDVHIIAITNDVNSVLAKSGHLVLPILATPEESITNKTFTNTLAILFLIEACMAKQDLTICCENLLLAAQTMEDIVHNRTQELKLLAKHLFPGDVIHFIGRDSGTYTLANQSALIFMEGASCMARAFTCGAFRHGPIEVCSNDHRVVVYAWGDQTNAKVQQLIDQMVSYGSSVVLVTDQKTDKYTSFHIDADTASHFVMAAAMVMELLLIEVAHARKRVPGEFAITKKICTVD